MQKEIIRRSPVIFEPSAAKETMQGEWKVVQTYENEGNGPHLVDLSHCPRWDLQGADVGQMNPMGIPVPAQPGQCSLKSGVMVNRLNKTQAAIWHLTGKVDAFPKEHGYTDVTDGTVFLALIGQETFAVTEQLTTLDLTDPVNNAPMLLQGPFAHVPCQIVVVPGTIDQSGVLLTCSRGYAHDMVAALLEAGEIVGLRPAGTSVFNQWLKQIEVSL